MCALFALAHLTHGAQMILFILESGQASNKILTGEFIDGTEVQRFKRRCHNHDLFLEAFESKQIGEDLSMSSIEMV